LGEQSASPKAFEVEAPGAVVGTAVLPDAHPVTIRTIISNTVILKIFVLFIVHSPSFWFFYFTKLSQGESLKKIEIGAARPPSRDRKHFFMGGTYPLTLLSGQMRRQLLKWIYKIKRIGVFCQLL
jgi:hypothetical protein